MNKETACRVLHMVCGELEESQRCARPEIGEALQHLESPLSTRLTQELSDFADGAAFRVFVR
jgi:hypothetical protein